VANAFSSGRGAEQNVTGIAQLGVPRVLFARAAAVIDDRRDHDAEHRDDEREDQPNQN